MSADSENPNIIGVIGRNIALWQNLWVGVGRFERRSSSACASLALCGRFNQFRSPYSWITMRRALRKRRVFDFVPSYVKFPFKRHSKSVRAQRRFSQLWPIVPRVPKRSDFACTNLLCFKTQNWQFVRGAWRCKPSLRCNFHSRMVTLYRKSSIERTAAAFNMITCIVLGMTCIHFKMKLGRD